MRREKILNSTSKILFFCVIVIIPSFTYRLTFLCMRMLWVDVVCSYDMLFNELEILLSFGSSYSKDTHAKITMTIPFLCRILLCMTHTHIRSLDALVVDCCKMIAIFNKEIRKTLEHDTAREMKGRK